MAHKTKALAKKNRNREKERNCQGWSLATSMGLAERPPILGIEALALKIGFANLWEVQEQRTHWPLARITLLK